MENETNLDLLKGKDHTLILNGKKIVVKELTINYSIVAQEKYTEMQRFLLEESIKVKEDRFKGLSVQELEKIEAEHLIVLALEDKKIHEIYFGKLIDICLYIIKCSLSGLQKLKYRWLTQKWLMNNTTTAQLTKFTEEVMVFLMGEKQKKKIEEAKEFLVKAS